MRFERFSWSKHHSIELCGQKFFYREVEKLDRPWGVSALRGRGIHRGVEKGYLHQLEHGERMATDQVVEIAVEEMRVQLKTTEHRVDGGYDEPLSQIKAVLLDESANLTRLYQEQIASLIDPVFVESKFEIRPSEVWPFTWVGVIDVSGTDQVIHDTKTKRKAPSKNTIYETGQPVGYEMGFRALHQRPSAGHAFDFLWQTPAKKQLKTVTQTREVGTNDLKVFAKRVKATHASAEAEVFLPAAGDAWICSERWCEFTDVCPYFQGKKERPES